MTNQLVKRQHFRGRISPFFLIKDKKHKVSVEYCVPMSPAKTKIMYLKKGPFLVDFKLG